MTRALPPLPKGFTREAVQRATSNFWERRRAALTAFASAEQNRREARRIRLEALRHLDDYLRQAVANLRRRGVQVHFAADAAEAGRTIVEIARGHGAKRIVKSKSMVTEEVHLNRVLADAGLEVVETDLGEYIVQLAGELPSHIVGPAIHKSREEIQALFEAESGRRLTPETDVLAGHARQALREKFLQADIGVSGGNFVVAETGTLVLVTNEGNGRLCTSLPRVHIALVGMEKLVPRLADLGPLLAILARSATGQKLSVYTHLVSGPRRTDELDGPQEMHVVFLDNGRSALLGTEFEEVLACIRCGACLNACPVYRQTGGHAYGSVYSGPIGAVLSPLYWGLDEFGDLAHASSLCAACWEICPVGIHLHDHLLGLRRRLVERRQDPAPERALFGGWARAWSRGWTYRASLALARALQAPFRRPGGLRNLPGPLGAWTAGRTFPPVAERTFHERWDALSAELDRDDQGGGGQGDQAGE